EADRVPGRVVRRELGRCAGVVGIVTSAAKSRPGQMSGSRFSGVVLSAGYEDAPDICPGLRPGRRNLRPIRQPASETSEQPGTTTFTTTTGDSGGESVTYTGGSKPWRARVAGFRAPRRRRARRDRRNARDPRARRR